jgi:hypothetical protein
MTGFQPRNESSNLTKAGESRVLSRTPVGIKGVKKLKASGEECLKV